MNLPKVPVTPTTRYEELREFLSAEEAATWMGLHVSTIRQKVKQGVIKRDERFRKILIKREDLKLQAADK